MVPLGGSAQAFQRFGRWGSGRRGARCDKAGRRVFCRVCELWCSGCFCRGLIGRRRQAIILGGVFEDILAQILSGDLLDIHAGKQRWLLLGLRVSCHGFIQFQRRFSHGFFLSHLRRNQRLAERAARDRDVGLHVAGIDSGGDHADAHHAFHCCIQGRADDDIGLGVHFLADAVGGFVQLKQGQVMRAGDVDQHTLGPAQRDFVQERVGDGFFGGLDGAIFALGLARAHHRLAHFVHHGADISEIKVDQARTHHQIGDTFHTLVKHVIGHRERFGEGGFFVGKAEQVLVGDDDQRIDHLLQCFHTVFGLTHALDAFKLEGLGHDAHGQNAQFPCSLRNDRCGTCSGATAHTGGDETHVAASQMINDLFDAFFGSSGTHCRPRARAQTFGNLHTHLDLRLGQRLLQRLCIGIGGDEIHAIERLFDHVVNRVSTGTAHTEHGDPGFQLFLTGHREIQCHVTFRLFCCPHFGGVFLPIRSDPTGLWPQRHAKNTEKPQNMGHFMVQTPSYLQMGKILPVLLGATTYVEAIEHNPRANAPRGLGNHSFWLGRLLGPPMGSAPRLLMVTDSPETRHAEISSPPPASSC